jgi:ABC-type sugar transport system ATPase subunit
MATITLESLEKRFGDVVAVGGIDLTIADGEFTVLLGPSGCGKTTTLNAIAGLEEPTAGRILFDGEEVQDVPVHKRDIAMVFQSYALYPNRTVRGNIEFGLRVRRTPKAEIAARLQRAAELVGLEDLLDRRPRELSGGQQQRVALARAIVRRPAVFLFDEPLSNLDAKLRAEMRVEIKSLQLELGGTFVYVTHDQTEAMSMADTVVVMNDGRVQQTGPPLEIYDHPVNLLVAEFIGSPKMNVIEGRLHEGRFEASGWGTPLPLPDREDLALGVRPEDASLDIVAAGAGQVRVIEHFGSETSVTVDMPFGTFVVRAAADLAVEVGARVDLGFNPRRVHLFDRASGEAVGVTRLTAAGEPV